MRLHDRAKVGYFAWVVIQAFYAVLFFNVGQSVSAAVHGGVYSRRRLCSDAVYRPGGLAFIIANIPNLTAITLITVISAIERGLPLFGLTSLLYSTLAECVSRWVQWLINVAGAVFFLSLIV